MYNMYVEVLHEAGYEQALLGMSLSYYDHKEKLEDWWDKEKFDRAKRRASALAFKGGGHNKFLESIVVWGYIQAPRAFWSEFDTYRVGMTKQSSSTMHTLSKRTTTSDDYEEGTLIECVEAFNNLLESKPDITTLKMNLPEGWLQERQFCTNYMVLQNIIRQRTGHRLKQWEDFISSLLIQVQHPELLVNRE